ncbi:MAG: carboxypeptidase-like regulatory domain-containing protein [Planctomycetota bacterium]
MKKSIWLIIVPGLLIAAGAIYFARGHSKEVENLVETVLPGIIPEEPSPYSIKWGAELGRIIDQEGNGVPEATVTFTKSLRRDCDGNITETPPEWQETSVTTNENGVFEYPEVIWQDQDEGSDRKAQPQIKIEAQGFLPRRGIHVGTNYANDNGEIDIFRVGRIEGAIIDPNGQPLSNVPLYLATRTNYNHPNSGCSGCFGGNTKTDESGGFVFEKVPPGQHIIKFPGHSGGCGPEPKIEIIPFKEYATFNPLHMKDGEVKTGVFLDLRQPRGSIKGKVVDKYNRPMAGVNAVLRREIKNYNKDGSGWSSTTENLKSVSTDEYGHYVLTHIPGGDYQLLAQYPYEKGKNYRSGKPLTIYLAGKQEVTFNLVLERQDDSMPKPDCRNKSLFEVPLPGDLGPREMMIVDPRGTGIAGAVVTFDTTITIEDQKTHQKTKNQWDGAVLKTDQRGVFTLPNELESIENKWVRCRVTIEIDGYEKRQTSIGPYHLKNDRRIDILPYSKIQGQLIGWDGEPVKGAVGLLDEMTAYHNPGSASSGGGYGGKVTDESGAFSFIQVPEGTHIFQYKAPNPETGKEHVGGFVVYTQNGEPVDDIVIDLRQDTCTARGRVLDWDGKPVKKATVRLCKSVQWGHEHFGRCTSSPEFYRSEKTNRKGEYRIENIRPGVYEIEAVLEGDKRRTSDKMTIGLGDNQGIELDVRLKR